jgi:energy-coupling factor transport system ATP-binding protein
VFQDPESCLIQELVEDELAFAPENLGVAPLDIEERLEEAVRYLAIPDILSRRTDELSGGQQQRVAVASILTMRPRIWLLDDPIASLDAPSAASLWTTLRELHQQGHTICCFSSRLPLDDPGADRLLILEQGQLTADGPYAEVRKDEEDKLILEGCLPKVTDRGHRVMAATASLRDREAPLVQVQGLSFGYGAGRSVLHNVHCAIHPGEMIAVTGSNGSGKTTFGKLLAGVLPAPPQSILIAGRPATDLTERERAQTIGYAFQNPEHQFIAPTVMEECVFGLMMEAGLDPGFDSRSILPASILAQGEEWLHRFGLAAKQSLPPQQLSVAEKQRLNLASILIARPSVLILDEPTAGLDYHSAERLMGAYADYAAQGHAVLIISHDLAIVRRYASQEWQIVEGRLEEK